MNRVFFPVMLVVVLVAATGWAVYRRTTNETTEPTPSPTLSASASPTADATQTPGPVQTLEGGVQVQDLVVGDGEEVQSGMTAIVHYAGWLEDETLFDSSIERDPFQFTVGAGQVIRGWDIGVVGMKVGGVRFFLIPPEMAYGAQGAGDVIPPNATLLFQVQLLGVGK